MLENFETQLKELLHASPYEDVDIHPLLDEYIKNKTVPQNLAIRKKIASAVACWEKEKLVVTGADYHFNLIYQSPLKFDTLPIFIRSTQKFEDLYYGAAPGLKKEEIISIEYIETKNRIAAFKKIMPSLFNKISVNKVKI